MKVKGENRPRDVFDQLGSKMRDKAEEQRQREEQRMLNDFENFLNQRIAPNPQVLQPAQPPSQIAPQIVMPPQQPVQPSVIIIPQQVQQQVSPEPQKTKGEVEQDSMESEFSRSEDIAREEILQQSMGDSFFSSQSQYYMRGTVGMANYSNATNVQSKMGAGFSIGSDISNFLAFEMMFLYSRHLIDESYWKNKLDIYQEMDQYNFGALGKYTFFSGFIQPYVSGIANITRRSYSEIGAKVRDGSVDIKDLNKKASSMAMDVGASLGLEFLLTSNFALGFDWRYMRNLYQETEFDFGQYGSNSGTPIEKMSYHIFGISGKARF